MYPRAERVAPSMFRIDHALTGHVLATACSSFTVDWTYENGVGDVLRASLPAGTPAAPPVDNGRDGFPGTQDDVIYRGVHINTNNEQPWFGLDRAGLRGVGSFHDYASSLGSLRPQTIVHTGDRAFEVFDEPGSGSEPAGYWAIFGYNQNEPLNPVTGQPWVPATRVVFTPLPSAIRITMVLHDPRTKLENGRVVQFVIDLPKRVN